MPKLLFKWLFFQKSTINYLPSTHAYPLHQIKLDSPNWCHKVSYAPLSLVEVTHYCHCFCNLLSFLVARWIQPQVIEYQTKWQTIRYLFSQHEDGRWSGSTGPSKDRLLFLLFLLPPFHCQLINYSHHGHQMATAFLQIYPGRDPGWVSYILSR